MLARLFGSQGSAPESSQDTAAEREALVSENEQLKTENSTLRSRIEALQEELSEEQENIRIAHDFLTHLHPPDQLQLSDRDPNVADQEASSSASQPSSPRRPPHPPTLFDKIPNELLNEILGHLHQRFHSYHYSNALNGVWNPPAESKPWNPVGLQLVNRRWRAVAKPLFYKQVALDVRDAATLDLVDDAIQSGHHHPLRSVKSSVFIAWGPVSQRSQMDLFNAIGVLQPSRSCPVILLHLDHGPIGAWVPRSCSVTTIVFGPSASAPAVDMCQLYGWSWLAEPRKRWIGHQNHLLVLRLPRRHYTPYLVALLDYLPEIAALPQLQVDCPFLLSTSVLETIFPTIASILQHPSLPIGREFVLKHTGNIKKIIFGAQTAKGATKLRNRIFALGELEVEVEVVVLEM